MTPIFTQGVYFVRKIEAPHKDIIERIKHLKWKNVIPQTTDYDCRQLITESNKILDLIPPGKSLKKIIEKYVTEAIEDFGYDSKFKMVTSWANCIKPHNISEFHNHKNFWLTAVYYPHGIEQDKFSIVFKKHDHEYFDIKIKRNNIINNNMCSILVKEGDLIIFPSYALHKIGYNSTKTDRYSLAFNFLPSGLIGWKDGEIKF